MRPAALALAAAILLGCVGGAAGFPLIPILAGVAFQSHSDIEAARWRHRHHRDNFRGDRHTDGADRDDTNSLNSQPNIDPEATKWGHRHRRGYSWNDGRTESARTNPFNSQPNIDLEAPKWRDRYRRTYGRNDRRSDSVRRDDTDAFGSNANRLPTTDIVRPDLRRRRGWVDPPPAN